MLIVVALHPKFKITVYPDSGFQMNLCFYSVMFNRPD